MSIKLFKRSIALTLSLIMTLVMTSTAFAAESSFAEEMSYEVSDDAIATASVLSGDSGTIPSNRSATFNLAVGHSSFSRRIAVNARSNSTSGALFLYLYDPDGNLVSHDWVMGVNEATDFTVYFVQEGWYELVVYAQGTTANVSFSCNWL